MPYGGSVTISSGLRSPSSRATASALVAIAAQDAMLVRGLPQSHRSPGRDTGFSGSGGAAFASSSSSGRASRSSISFGSKPVRLRSKSAALSSCSSRASSSSSQSAQVTERFTISRNAFTCASVHSSQRITGIAVVSPPGHDPSLRAAFSRRWPSTTSPSLRASTGILKPNSRMLLHMRSTAASFLRGLRA